MVATIRKPNDLLAAAADRCFAGRLDTPRMDEFLDHLVCLGLELGGVTCVLIDNDKLCIRTDVQTLHELSTPRAKTKLRALCARLAVRCAELTGQDVSAYGADAVFEVPAAKKACTVRFQNTNDAVAITVAERV